MRPNAALRSHAIPGLLLALAAACLGMSLQTLAGRLYFPWDTLLWAESPFMTNMMKLAAGQGIFTAPADANSFVYSPGLEYAAWALLRPFGLHLDAAWCRTVSVAPLFLAAGLAAWQLRAARLRACGAVSPYFMPLVFCLGAGLILRTPTAMVIHPDNLYLLHAMLCAVLCWKALDTGSVRWAAAALLAASLGVWAKQPAALAPVGILAALLVGRRWPRPQGTWLAALGLAAWGFSLAALLAPALPRFYLLELLLGQGVVPQKITGLLLQEFAGTSHRVLLFVLAPLGILAAGAGASPASRAWLLAWAGVGFFEVLPSLSAYLKQMGYVNSLGILDFWLFLAAAPLLDFPPPEGGASAGNAAQSSDRARAFIPCCRAAGTAAFLLAIFPAQSLPDAWVPPLFPQSHSFPIEQAHYERGELQDEALWRDLRAGRRVLVAHGTARLLHNGVRVPPIDRMNSVLELDQAGQGALAMTRERIAAGEYDLLRVPSGGFVGVDWYGPEIEAAIKTAYAPAGELPERADSAGPRSTGFMMTERIFRRRAARPAAAPAQGGP